MAELLGIAISTYNQYENGVRSIPNEAAHEICEILDIEISNFFSPKNFTISKHRQKQPTKRR